jgi:hypothetical protein
VIHGSHQKNRHTQFLFGFELTMKLVEAIVILQTIQVNHPGDRWTFPVDSREQRGDVGFSHLYLRNLKSF